MVLASFIFYGWWDYRFCSLLLLTITIDYVAGGRIAAATNPKVRKRWLRFSIISDLSILGFFKYYDLGAATINQITGWLGAATTRAGLLTSPLRDRFGIVQRLEFYNVADLGTIVNRSARLLNVPMDDEGAMEIARRSRGTPRIANRLLRRVRDFAEVKGTGHVSNDIAIAALNMLDVDTHGFDGLDRRYLLALMEKFNGGPAGVEALAAAIAEDSGTLEDVVEPYLIQQDMVMRTARGRVATPQAYLRFGLTMPESLKTQLNL